jgi:hypothetical protein
MALTDFLTNGQIPAGSGATSMTTQTVLPDWYSNYAMQLLANQQAASATPYATFGGPRVAEFTPQQQQAFGMTGQAATAYQPGLNTATNVTQQAVNAPGALTAAQPLLTAAGQSSVTDINAYMNPYTEQVVNRIGQLGARNLSENLLPQVEGRYIAAGQLGFGGRQPGTGTPSGMMADTARAIRDTQEATLAQQAQALQQGYGEALGASQADLARRATLAGLTGNLASTQTGQQLAGGAQLAGLAAQQQALGLTGADAVGGVGQQQQALNQQNLDVAYSDFLRQQGYPQAQIDAALKTFQGIAPAVPQARTEEGIAPLGYQPEYGPGTAATVAGGLTALSGLLSKGGALSSLFGG